MTRVLTFAAGLIVVIASGVVYGAWTQRWQKSADLEARAAKLRDLPDEFGRWKGRPAELDAESLALAGAEGWWVRRFTDERSGTTLLVILLCGRPGRLSVHKPETCYGAAGFEVEAPPVKYTPAGAAPDQCWTGKFKEDQPGGRELRIFWSWYGDGGWRVRQPALGLRPFAGPLQALRYPRNGRADDDARQRPRRRLPAPPAARGVAGAVPAVSATPKPRPRPQAIP